MRREPLTEERLVSLFKFDGKPYLLKYEWRKDSYKLDKPTLSRMLKEKKIEVVERDTKTITYRLLSE